MSKERMEKILNDHLWMGAEPSSAQDSILSAMEQYGKEQYDAGYTKGWADVANEQIFEDLTRLRELVKAQKELIVYLEESAATYDTNCDLLLYAHDIRNRIKELEK